MGYVNRLQDGMKISELERDIVQRLHGAHYDSGVGTLIVGTLACGGTLLYQQAHYAEDSVLEIKKGARKVALVHAETPEVLSALVLLDRKIERCNLA